MEKMKKEVDLLNEQVKEERKERKLAFLARDEVDDRRPPFLGCPIY